MPRAIYTREGAAQVEQYFDGLHAETSVAAKNSGSVFDSAREISNSALASSKGSGQSLPAEVQAVIARMPEDQQGRVLDSVLYGMEVYRREHNVLPTADVIQAALQQGLAASFPVNERGVIMDSVGSSLHHDQISSQPNRVVVAITSAIAEAFPAATYLPTDIGSNEARLGIVSHLSGSLWGGYTVSELMDGINVGKAFLSAERRITLAIDGPRTGVTGQFFTTVGGATPLNVLRGRTMVFINGFFAAAEVPNSSGAAATSPISGTVNLAGTDYTIGGTVNISTGALVLTSSPALPAGAVAEAEGFADYETNPTQTPEMISQVTTYQLFATPWRATSRQTIDSRTQYQNEIGVDLQSETLIAVRNQFAMERHYNSLNKLYALGQNNKATFDFDWTNQKAQKTRSQIWLDLQSIIGLVDQQMAEDTMDTGITHIYVMKKVAAQMLSMGSEYFAPSGIVARPGIYRLGRLFNRYEVYYVPDQRVALTETSTASQILCIGRSQQVARCPIVLGDAVSPTVLPLAMGQDMRYGNAFYARNFTSVNPHQPSARAAAVIDVTNLF